MMTDLEIREAMENGEIVIDPWPADWQIQPVSVDLLLSEVRLVRPPSIDSPSSSWLHPRGTEPMLGTANGYVKIRTGHFYLGSTVERITLCSSIAARVEGKSSVGRRGLMIHRAGLVDPGFTGQITLEMDVVGDSIYVPLGDPICQITFERLSGPVGRPYGTDGLGSRYQGQTGPTPARS